MQRGACRGVAMERYSRAEKVLHVPSRPPAADLPALELCGSALRIAVGDEIKVRENRRSKDQSSRRVDAFSNTEVTRWGLGVASEQPERETSNGWVARIRVWVGCSKCLLVCSFARLLEAPGIPMTWTASFPGEVCLPTSGDMHQAAGRCCW